MYSELIKEKGNSSTLQAYGYKRKNYESDRGYEGEKVGRDQDYRDNS
jgi:hypothetical protein